ncbi:MAG: 1-acyl-sn-glycerol-3-phosphate acyltransferase [Flavobacteriales bacterium]|nr:1-acyl-sn-glycerol-3-phosphate acyltransferase [Flavobacteriales bacterium]
MKIFKRDVLGNYHILKRILILLFGFIGYYRFFVVNRTTFNGLKHLKGLPKRNVLFISNHQTYFMDVFLMYLSMASVRNGVKNPRMLWYLINPFLNFYYVAAVETMKKGVLPKLLAHTGGVLIKRTWRENGQDVKRKVDNTDLDNIKKALADGWLVSFPQGTTTAYAKGRKGSAVIIKQTKPIVIPIQVNGFRKAFNKSGVRIKKRHTQLSITFKRPLDINFNDSADYILNQMMTAIGQSEDDLPDVLKEKVEENQ